MSEATNRVLEAQLRRQKQHDKRQKEWETALKPTTIDGSGVLRQLGQQPLDNRQILPNTASLNRPIRPTAVPGGVVADWLPRVKVDVEEKKRRKKQIIVYVLFAVNLTDRWDIYVQKSKGGVVFIGSIPNGTGVDVSLGLDTATEAGTGNSGATTGSAAKTGDGMYLSIGTSSSAKGSATADLRTFWVYTNSFYAPLLSTSSLTDVEESATANALWGGTGNTSAYARATGWGNPITVDAIAESDAFTQVTSDTDTSATATKSMVRLRRPKLGSNTGRKTVLDNPGSASSTFESTFGITSDVLGVVSVNGNRIFVQVATTPYFLYSQENEYVLYENRNNGLGIFTTGGGFGSVASVELLYTSPYTHAIEATPDSSSTYTYSNNIIASDTDWRKDLATALAYENPEDPLASLLLTDKFSNISKDPKVLYTTDLPDGIETLIGVGREDVVVNKYKRENVETSLTNFVESITVAMPKINPDDYEVTSDKIKVLSVVAEPK